MDYQVLFNWASGALTTMALLVVTLVITLLRGLKVLGNPFSSRRLVRVYCAIPALQLC